MNPEIQQSNKWKFATVILIIALVSVSFVALYRVPAAKAEVLSADFQPSIMDMQQGQTNTLTVYNLNGTAPYSYVWSVATSDNVTDLDDFTVFSTTNPAFYQLNFTVAYIAFKLQVTDFYGSVAVVNRIITDSAALDTYTLSGGIAPGAPSYTIFSSSDGSTFFAKNATNYISWSSTDAWYTIQNAITATPSGGMIKFTEAIFELSQSITLDRPVWLMGSGVGSFVDGAANEHGTKLRLADGVDDDVIKITGAVGNVSYTKITDLTIDGNKGGNTAGNGINFLTDQAMDTYINNVMIWFCADNGIKITQYEAYLTITDSNINICGGSALYVEDGSRIIFTNNQIAAVNQDALQFYGAIYLAAGSCATIDISHNWFYNVFTEAVRIDSSFSFIMADNYITQASYTHAGVYSAIMVGGVSGQVIVHGNIHDNNIGNTGTVTHPYCVTIFGRWIQNLTVHDNDFTGFTIKPVNYIPNPSGVSSNVHIYDNLGAAFNAKVSLTGALTVTNDLQTTVPFDKVLYDPQGAYNTTSHVYTAPSDGYYAISLKAYCTYSAAGTGSAIIAINGLAANGGIQQTYIIPAAGSLTLAASVTTYLNAGKTVSGILYQTSSGSANITVTANDALTILTVDLLSG